MYEYHAVGTNESGYSLAQYKPDGTCGREEKYFM